MFTHENMPKFTFSNRFRHLHAFVFEYRQFRLAANDPIHLRGCLAADQQLVTGVTRAHAQLATSGRRSSQWRAFDLFLLPWSYHQSNPYIDGPIFLAGDSAAVVLCMVSMLDKRYINTDGYREIVVFYSSLFSLYNLFILLIIVISVSTIISHVSLFSFTRFYFP